MRNLEVIWKTEIERLKIYEKNSELEKQLFDDYRNN